MASASAASAAFGSMTRYSRLYLADELSTFMVMIHAVLPSMMNVFSCVYCVPGAPGGPLRHTTPTLPAWVSVV